MEVREVFTEKVAFEKIPERCERGRYMDIWEKSLCNRGNYMCKGPEAGIFLTSGGTSRSSVWLE